MSSTASPQGDSRSRLPSLTGLRFLAAMSVFLFHTSLLSSPSGPMNPFADQDVANAYGSVFGIAGFTGVSFFFVLSGFVLTWSNRPGEPVRSFLRRRAVKIYPNHVVMWAISLLLFGWATGSPAAILPNLLLIHDYFPQPFINLSVNTPSWSLCAEILFYLSFPFLIGRLRRIPEKNLWFWAAAMVAGTFAVALINRFLVPAGGGAPISSLSNLQFWFGYLFPPPRMFEFVLGVLLALLVRAGKWPRIGIVPSALLLLTGYTAGIFVPVFYGFVAMTIVPIGLVIASVASADVHGRSTPFRGRVWDWLGRVSFAFYLCQGVTIFHVRPLLPGTFSTGVGILVLIGLFAITLIGGWLLYSRVEEPMMRGWSRARRPVTPAPPVSATEPVPGRRADEVPDRAA